MEWDGRELEFELRSQAGVVAAAVEEGMVTVLVLPDVDGDALRVLISAILATRGFEASVRVLGGMASPSVGSGRARRVAVGAVSGIGVLASVAAAAAMTGAVPIGTDPGPQFTEPARSAPGPRIGMSEHHASGTTVVPGDRPVWAAGEGSWPLPAALPPSIPAVELVPVALPPSIPAVELIAATLPPSIAAGEVVPAPVVPVDATPVVTGPARVAAAVPEAAVADVRAHKEPQPSGTGPMVLAAAPPGEPAAPVLATERSDPTDTDTDPDHGHGHAYGHNTSGHGDNGLHLGWQNGPEQAATNSAASNAPRGGRS